MYYVLHTVLYCIYYYRPPSEYATCEKGLFSRSTIPLHSSLVSVSIESVGSEKVDCPLIAILTGDRNVQLWRLGFFLIFIFLIDNLT